MAVPVLNNVKVFFGQFDISGDLNQARLDYDAEAKDKTTFGATTNGTRIHQGGVKVAAFSMGGLMQEDTAAIGKVIFDKVGENDVVLTAIPEGNTAGNVAYFLKALTAKFTPMSGKHGDLYAFNANAMASGHQSLVRGRLEHAKAARTATGTTSGYQLGAVSATQRLYAALHVFTVSGTTPTLDVAIQSDDNSGFTSATSRMSLTQVTAAAAELKSVAGAFTDDYWRASFTIGGTNPSFTFALAFGIL
jgi:hypothetical protein